MDRTFGTHPARAAAAALALAAAFACKDPPKPEEPAPAGAVAQPVAPAPVPPRPPPPPEVYSPKARGPIAWSDGAPPTTEERADMALGALPTFIGFSKDGSELAYAKWSEGAGFSILHIVSPATSEPVKQLELDGPENEKAARAYLLGKGYERLSPRPPARLAQYGFHVQVKGTEVTLFQNDTPLWTGNPFGGPVPVPKGKSAKAEVAGWSQDGTMVVVKATMDVGHEFGRAVGVQVVKVP